MERLNVTTVTDNPTCKGCDKTADMLAAATDWAVKNLRGFDARKDEKASRGMCKMMADFTLSVTAQQAQQIEDLTREVARLRKLSEPIWDERNSE